MTWARSLRVKTPGVLATVQDCGRRGAAHFGVSPSGAADWYSARAANALVRNDPCAALVEIALTGAAFELLSDARVAVTGAAAPVTADGRVAATWRSHHLPAGALVVIGPALCGARSYLAVDGGLEIPLVLGSASTDLGSGFGGFKGRALHAGDILPLGDVAPEGSSGNVALERSSSQLAYPPESIPHWTSATTLRVLPGPYRDRLPERALHAFTRHSYMVSSRSTRQGLQLEGDALELDRPMDIVSAGACAGCVQITSAGLPVVLLAEHHTTGGYATVACVTSADLPRAGQLRAGDRVRFEFVTQADAAHALASMRRLLGATAVDAGEQLGAGFHEGISHDGT
jgi:antagonist of KipI